MQTNVSTVVGMMMSQIHCFYNEAELVKMGHNLYCTPQK